MDEVVFSYSDVSYQYVMDKASLVMARGADFKVLGAERDDARIQGAGRRGRRRPHRLGEEPDLPQGVLPSPESGNARRGRPSPDALWRSRQTESPALRDPSTTCHTYHCTVEEMEEYEPHIVEGTIIYAGVDYEAILRQAEKEADVIVWDGGNNDMSFYKPDLTITVVDPHRPGHELSYYPGETNVRLADVIVVNKVDSALEGECRHGHRECASRSTRRAQIVQAASPITVDDPSVIIGESGYW